MKEATQKIHKLLKVFCWIVYSCENEGKGWGKIWGDLLVLVRKVGEITYPGFVFGILVLDSRSRTLGPKLPF